MAKHSYKCAKGPQNEDERISQLEEFFKDSRYKVVVYSCRYCESVGAEEIYKNVNKATVKKHEQSHYPDSEKLECQFCGSKIMRKDNLKKHVRKCKSNPEVIERIRAANSHLPLNN